MKKLFAIVLVVVIVLAILAAAVMAFRRRTAPGIGPGIGPGTIGGGSFRLKVSDPEYTALLNGEKTIEARLDRPPFNRLAAGDPIVVVRSRPKGDTSEYPGGKYKHDAEVVRVAKHKGIEALLKSEGVTKVYPGKSAAEAAARFSAYLPPGTTASDPVLAIELRAARSPPKKASKKATGRYGAYEAYDSYEEHEENDPYESYGSYGSYGV